VGALTVVSLAGLIVAIIGHHIGIDSSGGLISLDHPAGSSAWWGGVQDAFFPD
jgi:hypothetical protein